MTGFLTLKDGTLWRGKWEGAPLDVCGEVVFNTGMCGYVETLTDPSYAGEIIVFTYPLIGNYGVPDKALWESIKIHAKGAIVSSICERGSHASQVISFKEWLQKEGVALLSGVDTRALAKHLRTRGTVLGRCSSEKSAPLEVSSKKVVKSVSIQEKRLYGKGKKRVIALDCGMKESMVRLLSGLGVEVLRVPYNYDYSQEEYDGLFLSNGPGDPMDCLEMLPPLQRAMERKKPIYGVCLGSQLMALASGAKTYKLPFGHRGHNQPCMHLESKRCVITSQNHGYAVDEQSLSAEWRVSYRNLNDGSVEGIEHCHLPFSAVQFHPEACPGPTDSRAFFEEFVQCL